MKKKPTKYLSTKLMTISQKKGYFIQIQTSIHIEPCHSTNDKMITLQVEIMLQKKKYVSHIYTECINTLLLIKLSYNVLASDSCVLSGRMELSVD